MRSLAFVVAFLLVGVSYGEPRKDYAGAQVLRATPENESQLHYLRGLLMKNVYDFWTEPGAVGRPVDILATAFQLPVLKKTLARLGLDFSVHIGNVGDLLEESRIAQERAEAHRQSSMDWNSYHRYDGIMAWLESLATEYPDLCSIEDVGTSYEGRTMKLFRLGSGPDTNPGIFVDGGLHAREWISPAVVTYIINELVRDRVIYSDLLSKVNFYVMPVINPDGYEYSFTDERLWRKTRSDTDSARGCKGVDGNRNWAFHWMEVGASDDPCSNLYAGPEAFSEVEMRVVRDQILRFKDNLKAYLTFHSYSQLLLYPWGYTSDLPEDWRDLDSLAQDAADALFRVHHKHYKVGSVTHVLYEAAGGSDDWAKGVAGVKYSYTLELRDKGHYGFVLPATEIIPSGEETFEGFMVVANFIRDHYS